MPDEQWFYCLKHRAVEPWEGCRAADRLGPYPDRETAACEETYQGPPSPRGRQACFATETPFDLKIAMGYQFSTWPLSIETRTSLSH